MKFKTILLYLFLFSLFIFPPLKLSFLPFSFGLDDLLIVLYILIILIKNKFKIDKYIKINLFIIFLYAIWIFITIIFNDLFFVYNSYFEIYKSIKIIIIIIFFYNYIELNYNFILNIFYFLFIVNCILNIFNLFNIFNFNNTLLKYYSSPAQLDSFLYSFNNSISQRRILGISGNPNNNAIIFSFFLILFFILFIKLNFNKKLNLSFSIISFLFLLLTGSRTTFIAVLFSIILYILFINKKFYYLIFFIFFIFIFILLIDNFINISYIKSIWNMDLTQTDSFKVRIEVWKYLIGMIEKRLLLGYGPNKNFFYNNNLYSENEYIFILWKYGLIGFILNYSIIFIQIIFSLKNKNLVFSNVLFLFSFVLLLTSFTNCPLSDLKISSMFSFLIFLSYKEKSLKKVEYDEKVNFSRI